MCQPSRVNNVLGEFMPWPLETDFSLCPVRGVTFDRQKSKAMLD
jgi:hypothetical protein